MTKPSASILSLIMALAACGGSDANRSNDGSSGPGSVDITKGRELVRASDHAKRRGEYDKARALLKQARQYSNAELRHEIDYSTELIDKAHAKTFASDIIDFTKDGKCDDAITDTNAVIDRDEGLATFIRGFTSKAIHDCIVAFIENDELSTAAKVLSSKETAKALLPTELKSAQNALRDARAARITAAIQAHIDSHDWHKALETMAALLSKGTVSKPMHDKVRSQIRAGIAEDIDTLYQDAAAKPANANDALKQLDTLVNIGWPSNDDDSNDDAPPEAVRGKRTQLAVVAACHSIRCRTSEAQKRWTYGELTVFPVSAPRAAALDKPLRSGVLVWQLATGGGQALIALKDPGAGASLSARTAVAHGWVKASGLKSDDTSAWLPPGKALLGTRVWGPLRKGEPLYELGTVTQLTGATVTVRRLSDRQTDTITRRRLHFGLVKKGLKVLGYCESFTKLEPALVDSVKETQFEQQGDPLVTLSCIDKNGQPTGKTKEGQLGSLRIEPAWLPRRR